MKAKVITDILSENWKFSEDITEITDEMIDEAIKRGNVYILEESENEETSD